MEKFLQFSETKKVQNVHDEEREREIERKELVPRQEPASFAAAGPVQKESWMLFGIIENHDA